MRVLTNPLRSIRGRTAVAPPANTTHLASPRFEAPPALAARRVRGRRRWYLRSVASKTLDLRKGTMLGVIAEIVGGEGRLNSPSELRRFELQVGEWILLHAASTRVGNALVPGRRR